MIKKFAFVLFVLLSLFTKAQDLILVNSSFSDSLTAPAILNIQAQSIDYNPGEPAHLHIINTEGGYRKLKLGNNPNAIYSPKVDVIAGGNTLLKITLRDVSKSVDWSKIRFRPSSIGSLNLKPYVDLVGGLDDNWKTISIPLSDFDNNIDFSQVALIEFPYSADAAPFELDVAKIEFIGGSAPYLWYGETKTDNIHDGFGGAGQLIATSAEAIEAENNLESIELYVNEVLVENDNTYPFEFTISLNDLGLNTLFAIARFKDNSFKTSATYTVYIEEFIPLDLSISLNETLIGDSVFVNSSVKLEAEVLGAASNEAAFLSVINNNAGYLKLKLAYDPVNIYAPGKNVIAGGNDKLEIVLRNKSGFSNWAQLRLRPKSLGSLNLEKYVADVNGISEEWTTIEIPLSDFDPSIDFSNLNYMEFPYSADAGTFNLEIKDIIFKGGDQDFRWFGEDKIDNMHDGLGGAGQLIAEVIPAETSENGIEKVDFFVNDELLFSDLYAPFSTEYFPETENKYSIYAEVSTQNSQTETSATLSFIAVKPTNPQSDLKISFLSPSQGDSVLLNQNLTFTPYIEGEDLETDIYLKTWNTETGYRKLKLGYDALYIYGQFQNVILAGNDSLEIVLKSNSSTMAWDRIKIKPSSIGSLTLDKYVPNDVKEWTTIKIPLSDFDPSIDFTQLSYFEFPYSADAGAFEMGVKSIRFIGSESPFEWFGPSHYNNAHDGTGESGRIFAQLQVPNQNPLTADTVFFFVDGIERECSTEAPYNFNYVSGNSNTTSFEFKLSDSYGYTTSSDPIDIKFYDFNSEDFSVLTLTFDQEPTDFQIALAPLKYNKDFAYSFSFDDGKYDAYAFAYKLLNGGEITQTDEIFNGLFYSDGCNTLIPFRASVAWNSVSSSFYDIHIDTPDYITWPQLQELISAKWDVLNHSYSHAAYGDTDYNYQISENYKRVLEKTNYKMNHFVIPSGDLNYVDPAFNLNNEVIYSNKIEFLGYNNGIDVDSPFQTNQLKIYRRYMYDDLYDTSNIMEKINEVASKSENGNHIWYHDFTHRIIPTPTGGSLVWETFKFYMQQIEKNYGASGSDRIWFAPPNEILNYLKVRENTNLNYEIIGNTVKVYISTANIPLDLSEYFLSLNVSANAELLSISPQFSANTSFANTISTEKLVNIAWSQPTMKRMQSLEMPIEEENLDVHFDIYPNPTAAQDLYIEFNSSSEDEYHISLRNAIGQELSKQFFIGNKGYNKFDIDISNLSQGIYFLNIKNKNQHLKTEKIVIQ